jgi:alkanesulfonate monooxygenase SsuD/methylene tetrahydromethanopterin reductase-like flavin-dependent oxidoreductase (luciferase family)
MEPDKPSGTALALAGSTLRGNERVPMALSDLEEAVTVAEETGYGSVWVPDHGVWDPFALLSAFAHRTSRLGLASGVITVASRSADTAAAEGSTLAEVSGGRAILGLGSGPERRLHAVDGYLRRVRERLDRRVPIYLAALGSRMVELAGRAADGVLLNWCPPGRVARATGEVGRGAAAGGREPAAVTVAVYVRACLGHDPDHALEALRPMVATYAAMPAYRRQLEAEGLGELAAAAADARRRGDDAAVPEALVDALCVRGTREDALARFEEYRQAGADLVVVYPVTAQEPASSLMGTIMAAAPDPAVEH